MKTNNYDAVAPFYDFLSRMVFFKAQLNAQIAQLVYIPKGSRVLIVGGGSGWILEEIAKIRPAGLTITYVEISGKMLDLAKKRDAGANQVTFIHAGIEEYPATGNFDVILTAFLFDNFAEPRLHKVLNKLDDLLEAKGLWLFVDFKLPQKQSYGWKHLMLKMMYAFFSILAHVEAKQLHHMEGLFLSKNYQIINRNEYYRGFIESIIFRKSGKLPTFI